MKKKLQSILSAIKGAGIDDDGYSIDKQAIRRVFELTDSRRADDVIARLTLIDGMYSTQMNRRYYPFEQMSDMLVKLNNQTPLVDTFISFIDDTDTSRFDMDDGNLWRNCYGIGKDGTPKGAAVSLISKYAYFETGCRFPIYDSIACEVIPALWPHLLEEECPKLTINDSSQRMIGDKTIVSFTKAAKRLTEVLNTDFDTLDRLLWYTGKMLRGNFSLVFSKEEYIAWAEVAKQHGVKFTDDDLACAVLKVDADELPFLDKSENKHVKMIYQLARELKQ